MNENANAEKKNEVLKSDISFKSKVCRPKLYDRLSAVLEISNPKTLINDSQRERTERLKNIKAYLELCDIKPAAIESFSNRILITWIPKKPVLCETYEEYVDLCLEFSKYIESIKEVKLKISPSMKARECNYYFYEICNDIQYLEPKFTKDNFNYSKKIIILDANYKIDI
ncbi:hypothetical protein [Clostridium scatologenes]|uniref:Uncharacterized protein n=1 Tax=Clostridium scatologenes TaxID=1548 RepID=A0A0E3K309_CLOSL|nr:hypothetical protein [Clostridium scatologenes]AKA70868.1 hypothetical protein CSCA_3743 [Clostridium scatologenes]